MLKQSNIIAALAELPTLIIATDDDGDGDKYFFKPMLAKENGVFQIRYERVYREGTPRADKSSYMLDGKVIETIAKWGFQIDCDFHKELGNFLNYLQSKFSIRELYYE